MKLALFCLVLLLTLLSFAAHADPIADKDRASFMLERVCELIAATNEEPDEFILRRIERLEEQMENANIISSLLGYKIEFVAGLDESNPAKAKVDNALQMIHAIEPSEAEWITALQWLRQHIYTGDLESIESTNAFKLVSDDYRTKLIKLSSGKLAQRRLELEQLIPKAVNASSTPHEDVEIALRSTIAIFQQSSHRYEPITVIALSVGNNVNAILFMIDIFALYLARDSTTTFDECSMEDFIVTFEAYLAKSAYGSYQTNTSSSSVPQDTMA